MASSHELLEASAHAEQLATDTTSAMSLHGTQVSATRLLLPSDLKKPSLHPPLSQSPSGQSLLLFAVVQTSCVHGGASSVALATAAISIADLVPSRKEQNIYAFRPPWRT